MSSPNAQAPPGRPEPVLAISATFTAEPVEEILEFWMDELGLSYQVKFASYNQVFQQLLDPASLLARNRNGMNVALARLEDWARFHQAIDLERLEENVRHLASCLQSAAASFGSPLIVCLCPDSPAFLSDPARAAFARRMSAHLETALEGVSTVHLITPDELAGLYPVPAYFDPHGDELGHIPYTSEFFAALGTALARKITAIRTEPFKVVALDCDDTLWDGICGEDGPQGVVLDPPRRALQDFMRRQLEAGMLLALSSKNNEEDVVETFRVHPEMPLQLDDFVARRINWEPKSGNLAELAADLDLGLDSFILVDDNPKECAEVEAGAPDVLCLLLPADSGQIPRFLEHLWAFDRAHVTAEDRSRAAMYAGKLQRAQLEKQASSIEEFIASLQLDVRIAPLAPEQLPRAAQLTQRTNQMNLTTVRRTEADLAALMRDGAGCLAVTVTDRFGSYGMVGLAVYRTTAEAVTVDTLLLSCRALGRGVEHRMLARLGELAKESALARVDVPFIPSQRNRPARKFLESAGPQFAEPSVDGLLFRFPADYAAAVTYKPTAQAAPGQAGQAEARPAKARRRIDYVRIATELREPARILEAVRARKPVEPVPVAGAAAPRTGLEARLAVLWAELLRVPAVGVNDNFFDLGGHSLLAVQLLSRVRKEFGVDLSLEIVYGGAFTVAELARAIERGDSARAGEEDYAALLGDLSEEEIRALLAEGGDPAPR